MANNDRFESAVTELRKQGLDVSVHNGSNETFYIKADGIFGQTSHRRVKEYQALQGLPVTGVADISLIAELTS